MNDMLNNYENNRVVVVSHGAAMRFYLMNYCKLTDDIKLKYNGKVLDFSSPSIIKLTFEKSKILNISNI